jgi:thiol:disulfide interchange protein DsbA
MKRILHLLLITLMLAACGKHPPTAADKHPATAAASKKSKSTVAATSESSSAESNVDSDTVPMQLSETDATSTDIDSKTSQPLSLKELQPPATPSSAWKEGVHYKRLSPVQPTSALPGQVEVTEAYWYGSAHCYVLDQSIEVWLKQKANYINFVRLPVMWGSVQRLHARMYYIAELLGKTEELHAELFKELLVNKSPLNTNEQAQAFFIAHGISQEDYKRANASPAIEASLKHAQIIGDRYRINAVPMIIINGRYVTDVVMAGGQAQLLVLINELAAREKND